MFDPIPQIFGFIVAITFMSLPAVAASTVVTGAFILMKLLAFTGTPERPALAASGVQINEEHGSASRRRR